MNTIKWISPFLTACLLLLSSAAPAGAQDAGTATATLKTSIHHDALVSVGKDVELKEGDTAEAVVVIGGNALVHGNVDRAVVVIGGDAEIFGNVGDNVVAVMGDVHLGPRANVHRDLVTVGGKATTDDGSVVGGQAQEVGIGNTPGGFLRLHWLRNWVRYCVMELRPLSFHVWWLWCILGVLYLLYFLIAVLFPHPVQCCVNQISARPATTLAVGILAKLAMPFIVLLLLVTVLGIFVIPFLVAAALLAFLVGKVAIAEYLGGKLMGGFGGTRWQTPLLALLLGVSLLTLLYLIPIIGLLVWLGVSLWGFGAAVTAVFIALRRERPVTPPPGPTPSFVPPPGFVPSGPTASFSQSQSMPTPTSTPAAGTGLDPTAAASTTMGPAPTPAFPTAAGPTYAVPLSASPTASAPMNLPHALAFPRAGFWERMGAGFLDIVLLCLTTPIVGPFVIFVAVAYFAGMWAWKGTTVGGIVLGLHVVREDGQPMTFLTAFVRSVAAVFSAFVLFLGFFWIGWDGQKQGWHDKIAGTVVVRLPKSIPLVCL